MGGSVNRRHRFERSHSTSLQNWKPVPRPDSERMDTNVALDCGWGRLIVGYTYRDNAELARTLCDEEPGKRDIAIYLRDPHVVISIAPQELFLDPSHTFRLWLDRYHVGAERPQGFIVRRMLSRRDAEAINTLYGRRHMVRTDPEFLWEHRESRILTYLVAEDLRSGAVIGTATGVDHREAFSDTENGASLWCLAVDPQAPHPGVGEALVRQLAGHYLTRGRAFLDLSVMHDNGQAIGLYRKLGFVRVPVFTLKHKNPVNEPLFIAPAPEAELNPYAAIIVTEARRRGIAVEVLDQEAGYLSLSFGGRTVVCRESLSELTTAVAMSRCDDKQVTRRVLEKAGLRVPAQRIANTDEENLEFLERYGRIVVKPARGEQGTGVSVDLRTPEDVARAVEEARRHCERVLLEEFVEGEDLRIVVIDDRVVAAAVRRPPRVIGTGRHSVEQLIAKQSRRRAGATGGESRIPLDEETRRCVAAAGYRLQSTLPAGEVLQVRRTANLHTGGTIHDVTADLHPHLGRAAVDGARALHIPVVGLDFLVPRVDGEDYVVIEANERPGLANHEPQPTAQRFIDLLFPLTAK